MCGGRLHRGPPTGRWLCGYPRPDGIAGRGRSAYCPRCFLAAIGRGSALARRERRRSARARRGRDSPGDRVRNLGANRRRNLAPIEFDRRSGTAWACNGASRSGWRIGRISTAQTIRASGCARGRPSAATGTSRLRCYLTTTSGRRRRCRSSGRSGHGRRLYLNLAALNSRASLFSSGAQTTPGAAWTARTACFAIGAGTCRCVGAPTNRRGAGSPGAPINTSRTCRTRWRINTRGLRRAGGSTTRRGSRGASGPCSPRARSNSGIRRHRC
jgi:hypothetical protein